MKRLVDSDARDGATERARQVLLEVRPLPDSEARMQRVRAALERAPSSRRRRWAFPSRPLVLALLVGAGVAAAAASPWWSEAQPAGADSTLLQSAARRADAQGAPGKTGRGVDDEGDVAPDTAVAQEVGPVDERNAETEAQLPSPERSPSPSDAVRGDAVRGAERHGDPKRSPGPTPRADADAQRRADAQRGGDVERSVDAERPSSMSDVQRVHAAATALRRDGDPRRALRLLDGVSSGSGGALAEEALALRVEAARRAGDPRAQSYAESYLSRYPKGRYAASVRESLRAP